MTADKMFIEVKVSANKVRWISIRGSSKLEGFHKNARTVLSSGQTGAKLAAALLCKFVGRWNLDRGVANRSQRSNSIPYMITGWFLSLMQCRMTYSSVIG